MSNRPDWHRVVLCALLLPRVVGADPVYHIGNAPDPALVAHWDIAIGPDGKELPAGNGSVSEGAALYATHCAACHGETGREGPDPQLVGGHGSLDSTRPERTIGSYWSHATTLYDYINRAMPFFAPGSLTSDQVYALCAFLLHANGIVEADTVLDKARLTAIKMPNHGSFDPDPRPDVK